MQEIKYCELHLMISLITMKVLLPFHCVGCKGYLPANTLISGEFQYGIFMWILNLPNSTVIHHFKKTFVALPSVDGYQW